MNFAFTYSLAIGAGNCSAVMSLAAGIATSPAQADEWNKKTVLTVSETIQIRDTVLEPGQYVLKLSILNRTGTSCRSSTAIKHTLSTRFWLFQDSALYPTGKTEFTFWETPPGTSGRCARGSTRATKWPRVPLSETPAAGGHGDACRTGAGLRRSRRTRSRLPPSPRRSPAETEAADRLRNSRPESSRPR